MNMKLITIFYVCFILFVIALANQGELGILAVIVYEVPYTDKLGHFILMGLLAFFLNLSLKCSTISILNSTFLKGSIIILILVTLEEISQLLVETRTFDLMDLFADYLGIFVFGRLALYFNARFA
ncbi:VanZ family protein [Candidatus Marithrix sp. Canyon 246]|uniref:VanZ family protein n=2 Tax=Candidatus Marithrix sp. Canyon 246 TaxID=1827136 RepID=UPI000849EDF3|nr:VanZ family protein [Candidatus Marithrix sp. Canyon 246]